MPTFTFALIPFLLITLPWLNPFTFGPSAGAAPLLFSWACALALVGFWRWAAPLTANNTALAWVIRAWWAAATLSALIGLLQYFGAVEALAPWVNSTQPGEAFANLRQRNQFATLCNIGLAAVVGWLLWRTTQVTRPTNLSLAGAWVSVGLLQVGNAASASRTGLLQLVLLLGLFGLWGAWRNPHAWRALIVAALAYALAAVALPTLLGLDPLNSGMLARLQDGDALCASRLTMWRNVLHLIAQKPLLGWGWGELDYAHFMTLYDGPRFCEILDNAHNLPLQLAVELGLPVALASFALGVWAVWLGKPWRERVATRQMAWAVIAVILLHSLLEYPLWYGPFQMALGLSLWLLWHTPQHPRVSFKENSTASLYWRARATMLFIALVTAGIGYTTWDYIRVSQLYLAPSARLPGYQDQVLEKASASYLFQSQVDFAALYMLELTPETAVQVNQLATSLLHFSPEPRVVERLIESAELLKRADEAAYYRTRYQAAFPARYAAWSQPAPDASAP